MRASSSLFLIAAASLAACSGGGGSDGGGGFTMSGQSASFTAIELGTLPASQTLTITVTGSKVAYVGAGYRQGQTRPPWLGMTMTAGPTPTTALLQLSILSTAFPPATFSSTFVVGTADTNGNVLETKDVTVTYTVTPHPPRLVSTQAEVVLGGADGLSTAPATLVFSLDSSVIPSCDYSATASTVTGGDWLLVTPSTGTVPNAGTTVQLAAQPGLTAGTYTGQVQIACTAGGTPLALVIPVTLNVEAHRLVVGAVGVGLSSAPSRSVLARSLAVKSTLGRTDVPWSATSDQAWLTVTGSGTTGGSLELSADPAGLAADTTHFATVTVTSSDSTVENAETIRVGLAVRSADPGVSSALATGSFLVASPVEPVVFVSNGGADVLGYDVYSGALVRTFSGVATSAGSLAMSGDGERLFVYDHGGHQVVEVDAVTGAVVRNLGATATGSFSPSLGSGVAWVRPAGAPVLITPASRMYDLATGTELADRFDPAPGSDGLVTSLDGDRVVTVTGAVYRMHHTALNGGRTWAVYETGSAYSSGEPGEACLGADGVRVYRAAGFPYEFTVWNTATNQSETSLPGAAYPGAIACAWNGLVVGGADAYYDAIDVWVYFGPTGAQLATMNSTGVAGTTYRSLSDRGIAISSDATRVVTLVSSSYATRAGVRFQSLPSPP